MVEPNVVQPTFWWSVGFNTFVLAGAMLLVYAVGGPAVILASAGPPSLLSGMD